MPRTRASKPRSFYEPWEALQEIRAAEPPNVQGFTEDVAQSILENHARTLKTAPWYIWGTGMTEPARVHAPTTGAHSMTSGRQIIAVRRVTSDKEDAPTPEEMMKRIAECVNALAGVADPVTFIESVRSLLLDYCVFDHPDPSGDLRFATLLGRCIPPKELEKHGHGEE